MPRIGFDPTIRVFERTKQVHALVRAATCGRHKLYQVPAPRLRLFLIAKPSVFDYIHTNQGRLLKNIPT
jgi:hypothetical protein